MMEELHACANFSVLRLWDYDEAAIMQLTEVSYTPECWGGGVTRVRARLDLPLSCTGSSYSHSFPLERCP